MLLARLEELRSHEQSGHRISRTTVEHCYVALAAMSPSPDARGAARRMGDETINGVRRRFSRGKLVRAGGKWLAPNGIFIGKPIFHDHGDFVPASAERALAPA